MQDRAIDQFSTDIQLWPVYSCTRPPNTSLTVWASTFCAGAEYKLEEPDAAVPVVHQAVTILYSILAGLLLSV